MLNFLYRSEFDASCGCLAHVFVVVTFVFAWSRGQMDELVSWLSKPILVLLEGGAS